MSLPLWVWSAWRFWACCWAGGWESRENRTVKHLLAGRAELAGNGELPPAARKGLESRSQQQEGEIQGLREEQVALEMGKTRSEEQLKAAQQALAVNGSLQAQK